MTTDPNWLKSITESYRQEVSESARNLQEEAEDLYNLVETIQTALNVDLTEAQVDALINVFEMDDIEGKLKRITALQAGGVSDGNETVKKYGGTGPDADSIARGRLAHVGAKFARRLKAQGTGIEPSGELPKRLSTMDDNQTAGIPSAVKTDRSQRGVTVYNHPTSTNSSLDGSKTKQPEVTAGTLKARRDATQTLRMNSPEGKARNKPDPKTGKKAISPLGHIDRDTLRTASDGNASSQISDFLRAETRSTGSTKKPQNVVKPFDDNDGFTLDFFQRMNKERDEREKIKE